MPKLTQAEELGIAIKIAAAEAGSKTSSREAAESFYDSEPELIGPFVRSWVVEKLATLIGKHRAKAKRENQPQLMFEESLGFKRLPRTLKLDDGGRLKRPDFTIGIFRKFATELRHKEDPALLDVNNAIALMAKYTANEPRITWGEVLEREAKRKR